MSLEEVKQWYKTMTPGDLKGLCREMSPEQHEKTTELLYFAIQDKSKEHSNQLKNIFTKLEAFGEKIDNLADAVTILMDERAKKINRWEKIWNAIIEKSVTIAAIVILAGIVTFVGKIGLVEFVNIIK